MRQPPECHARMWDRVATLDVAPRLSALTCPVLVVAGEADPGASPAAGQAIVERMVGAELAILAGCGHFPQREHPAECDRLPGAFLRASNGNEPARAARRCYPLVPPVFTESRVPRDPIR